MYKDILYVNKLLIGYYIVIVYIDSNVIILGVVYLYILFVGIIYC